MTQLTPDLRTAHNMGMRILIAALLVVIGSGCQVPVELETPAADAPDVIAFAATPAPTPEPSASPSPTPSASPSPVPAPKSILSAWVRIGEPAKHVDMSAIVNFSTSPTGILAPHARADWVMTASVTCMSYIDIDGTESAGTINITEINSGSASANAAYCTPFKTIYEYSAMAGDQLRLCRQGTTVCHYYQ